MVEGSGRIEVAEVVERTLRIEGWAATRGAGAVDGFEVACAGHVLQDVEVELRLPSPDVAGDHSDLDQASHCRFRIRARLDAATAARARSSAITCTPRAGGEACPILVHLIEPFIPLPTKEEAERIGGSFLVAATDYLGYLIQLAGMKRDSHVLDPGCGLGRMAFMLAHYLGPNARYEGFDIMEDLVRWAQREITSRAPQFRFEHANIYNKGYNDGGTIKASEFQFPYRDESFDVVFLTSVFTHMLAGDLRHYLDEIHRVLKPGGRCLATSFLMNDESRVLIGEGRSSQALVHPVEEAFTVNPEIPEWAVGFDEDLLLGWIAERRFTLAGKYYGGWCGRGRFTDYQDILVLEKSKQRRWPALRLHGGGSARRLAGLFRNLRSGQRAASA